VIGLAAAAEVISYLQIFRNAIGPKIREGDHQAPEGFYDITLEQMNPLSHEYLSFNIGFPNLFDRSLGRTGSFIMVHGGCRSIGCYAMTDEQMDEIYGLVTEAFRGGQDKVQLQAFSFRHISRCDPVSRSPLLSSSL